MPDTPETVLKPELVEDHELAAIITKAVGAGIRAWRDSYYCEEAIAQAVADAVNAINDIRTPSSAAPEVSELVERLIKRVKIETQCGNRTENPNNHVRVMDEAATALQSYAARVEGLEKALQRISEGCGMLSQPAALNGPEEAWLRRRIEEYERTARAALLKQLSAPSQSSDSRNG